MYDKEALTGKLKDLLDDYMAEQDATIAKAEADKVAKLKPGETVTKTDGWPSDEARSHMAQYGRQTREKMDKVINAVRDGILDEMAEAPSEEAARAVQILASLPSVDRTEFEAVARRFGGNYMVSRALSGIAREKRLGVSVSHPIEFQADCIAKVGDAYKALAGENTSSGNPRTPGEVEFVLMNVPNYFENRASIMGQAMGGSLFVHGDDTRAGA